MSEPSCAASTGSPSWSLVDLFAWKIVPDRLGGGIGYLKHFKDAWVQHNKAAIRGAADRHALPAELLAGVCWVEVGGDPTFIDRVAFEVRTFDWSGPGWVDRHLTVTHEPARTSFGAVSMQLRTAARTIGLEPSRMTTAQWRRLAHCLEQDMFNIDLAGRHLRQLVQQDCPEAASSTLTMEQVRLVGARYNRGTALSLNELKKNTSYGDFIVKHWPRFASLLQ